MDPRKETARGEALFSGGKLEEAKNVFEQIVKDDPDNFEAVNNLGAVYYTSGDEKAAEAHFLRALEIKKDYAEALNNIILLYQDANRWHDAALHLERLALINSKDTDALNRLAITYLKAGNIEKPREVLAKSLKLNPDQEIARQSLTALEKKDGSSKDSNKEKGKGGASFNEAHSKQNRRTKIAVLCLPGLQSFLGDIVDFLKSKHDVRTCYSNNKQEIASAIRWSDLVWLEWANEIAVYITRNIPELSKKKVICRLHSYEAFSDYPKQMDWTLIDTLVVVADHIKNIVLVLTPEIRKASIHVIPNGINLDAWKFAERKPGYNIAYVGSINGNKGSILLPHLLKAVCDRDSKYRLHIAGEIQDFRYVFYFKQMLKEFGLIDDFIMCGKIDNVNAWLEDKNYIVSTSPLESQQLSLCEAMAKGIKPVIHNFVGARSLYPDKYIFNSIQDAANMICDQTYNSASYRQYIEERYNMHDKLDKIEILIGSLTKDQAVLCAS